MDRLEHGNKDKSIGCAFAREVDGISTGDMLNNDVLKDLSLSSQFHLERQRVKASEVFHDRRILEALQQYRKTLTLYEGKREIPPSVARINNMSIPEGYIPEDLSHQNLVGRKLVNQARYLNKTDFIKAIESHEDYTDIPGFEIQKRLVYETVTILNMIRRVTNIFRKKPIQPMISSNEEVRIARICYGSLWPAGINLYEILRDIYPAFHARITGQVPAYIGNHMDELLDVCVKRNDVQGIGRISINDQGRFLGLYPVARVPADSVTSDSMFVAQDQIGRKAIIKNILKDITEIVQSGSKNNTLIIDYAGGVGNMSELLIEGIAGLSDAENIIEHVRFAIIDVADNQLEAGKCRFRKIVQSRFSWIKDKYIFLNGDATKPISKDHMDAMKVKFGKAFMKEPTCLGMTSYTIGALDNFIMSDGTTMANAMADEMFNQCWKVYAVDFSSPMWRVEGFVKDTGKWGEEYLRAIHGRTDEMDEKMPLNNLLSWYLRMRFGLSVRSIADFVRLMAKGPALATHYTTVWPYRDGHNAGYCVLEDGTIKKPGIISFAQRLQRFGAPVYYRSKVMLVGALDIGKTSGNNRVWAFMPGWIADFVIAENEKNHYGRVI